MVNFEGLKNIEVNYNTLNIPAPYCYCYNLKISFPEGIENINELQVEYKLEYTDRDGLEDEEILDEGFSLNDDYTWQGKLPPVWHNETLSLIKKTSWPQKKPVVHKGETSSFNMRLEDEEGNVYDNVPANKESWEYFLQEMIQAIYEISSKEMPLEVKYKEIDDQKQETSILIQPFFSSRTVKVKIRKEKQPEREKQIEWQTLKPILKNVYFPDYDYEYALEKTPLKKGKFIDNGEGVWYEFGVGVKNPNSKINSLERLEQSLKGLIVE